MTVRRGLVLTFLVAAVLAAGAVVGASGRSDLDEARRQIDRRWAALEPSLETRYQALSEIARALGPELGESPRAGGDPALDADAAAALARWESLRQGKGRVEQRVLAASALEGLLRRITVTVEASPRLRASKPLAAALAAGASAAPEQLQEHNSAVRHYENLRGSLPRRLLAGAFGFDARPTLELPS